MSRSMKDLTDEAHGSGRDETATLHVAYLSSLRRHRDLMDDLCDTLEHFDRALAAAKLPRAERAAIAGNLSRHIDQARTIMADMDRVLARALSRPGGPSQ